MRKKTKVSINVSSNLYDMYKPEYNFSKIIDEVLMMFLIVKSSSDVIEAIEADTISFHSHGKEYIIKSNELRKYIQYLMDESQT